MSDTKADSKKPEGPPSSSDELSPSVAWLIIGIIGVSLIGFPIAILLWPPTVLSYRDAFLGLAMIPGVLLGGAGVWLALASRS